MLNRHSPLLIAISLFLTHAAFASGTSPGPQIPSVQGSTFTGAKVNLPEDLGGKVGILVVSFSENSRDAATAWGKQLANDYYDSSSVLYYQMPVLAAVPKMIRGFVQGRIKSSVSDRGKAHFLPLFDNEMSWRALAHYNKPDDAYILLVDSAGRVRWQSQGPPSAEIYATLKQQVAAIAMH